MELEASSRTYLEANSVRSLRAKRRLPEGNTVAPVHSISEKTTAKKDTNQADKSGGAAYHTQLTFDDEARLSSASIVP